MYSSNITVNVFFLSALDGLFVKTVMHFAPRVKSFLGSSIIYSQISASTVILYFLFNKNPEPIKSNTQFV